MKEGFYIYYEYKNILLQVLISISFALLFPLVYRFLRSRLSQQRLNSKGFILIIVWCGAISLVVCSIFASRLFDLVPLNLGLIPLFIAILYGGYKWGIFLAALNVICYFVFDDHITSTNFLLHTGILVYPFLFHLSPYFLKEPLLGKTKKLGVSLLIAMTLIILSPLIDGYDISMLEIEQFAIGLSYVVIATLCGIMVLYVIEFTFEKWLLREQLDGISEKYLLGEERIQQVMDISPICMVSVDRDGLVTSINDRMMTLYQLRNPELKKSDVLGHPIRLFIDPLEVEHVSYRISQALQGVKVDQELVKSDSRINYMSTSPLTNSYTREILGVVIITQDITELERLRSELGNVERLSLVGQMAASITHEIRNPMSVVRGFLQLMKEKSPSSLDHYYRIVMEELDRANSIINDFLSLAQNRVSEKEECYIDKIINDLSPLLWADANLRGQTIELRLDDTAPKLMLNAKEIKQLILNLARNGMEAMGEKGQLILWTKATATGVELIVQDNGSGIPKSKQDKLFTPFFSTKEKGTGLGLSLCLTIVERHKGKIIVDSDEGIGTSIIVNFPASYLPRENEHVI